MVKINLMEGLSMKKTSKPKPKPKSPKKVKKGKK